MAKGQKRKQVNTSGNSSSIKRSKWTGKRWTIIGIALATIISLLTLAVAVVPLLPRAEVKISMLSWSVYPTYNSDNTTFTGLNATFPAQITSTGNVPVHIVACDVFLGKNGKPTNLSDVTLSEIYFLKPQDSFSYNFSKSFSVSIPVMNATIADLTSNYFLVAMYYYQDQKDVKSAWLDTGTISGFH